MELDIEYLAYLSKLELSNQEKESFKDELVKTIEFVGEIDKVEIPEIAEDFSAVSLSELRDDEPFSKLNREDILLNAQNQKDGCFVAPLVVE